MVLSLQHTLIEGLIMEEFMKELRDMAARNFPGWSVCVTLDRWTSRYRSSPEEVIDRMSVSIVPVNDEQPVMIYYVHMPKMKLECFAKWCYEQKERLHSVAATKANCSPS